MFFWKEKFLKKIDTFFLMLIIGAMFVYIFFVFFIQFPQSKFDVEIPMMIKKIEASSQKIWKFSHANDFVNSLERTLSLKEKIFYEKWLSRDIFHPIESFVKKETSNANVYVLMNIERKKLPFVWVGTLTGVDKKTRFVQMNSKKGTFFLKKDDKMGGYLLRKVTPYYLELQKEGSKLFLRMKKNEIVLEDLPRAKIYDKKNHKVFIMKEGEWLKGWMVHSILKESVVLRKGNRGILVTKEGSSQE